ncbi:MAG TPA: methyltransferase domain-containing protein, partial [Candidatus Acidoferrales bacterium]
LHLRVLHRMTQTIPYLRVKQVDIARPETFPDESKFDSVLCLNGIEHVADDVAALRNLRHVLDDAGRIIVLVPQGPGLYGSLDEVLGHHRRYTRQQLVDAGERAGLRAVRVLKFNRSSVPAWWVNGRLLRKRKFGYVQMKVLNLLVPVLRVVDRWIPLPPLSLIAVFEKADEKQVPSAAETPAAAAAR